MKRTMIISALLTVALLVGSAMAQAASFSGTWVATVSKTVTLQMQITGNGPAYTGTYSDVTVALVKNKTPVQKVASQPLSGRVILVNKVPTLFVTLPKQKPPVTFTCTLSTAKLVCVTPRTRITITFTLKKP